MPTWHCTPPPEQKRERTEGARAPSGAGFVLPPCLSGRSPSPSQPKRQRSAGRLAPPMAIRGARATVVPISGRRAGGKCAPGRGAKSHRQVHQSASAILGRYREAGLGSGPVCGPPQNASKPTRKVRGRGGGKSPRRGAATKALGRAILLRDLNQTEATPLRPSDDLCGLALPLEKRMLSHIC